VVTLWITLVDNLPAAADVGPLIREKPLVSNVISAGRGRIQGVDNWGSCLWIVGGSAPCGGGCRWELGPAGRMWA